MKRPAMILATRRYQEATGTPSHAGAAMARRTDAALSITACQLDDDPVLRLVAPALNDSHAATGAMNREELAYRRLGLSRAGR